MKMRGGDAMFIHLGGDILVNSKKIIAILNAESVLGANSSKDFIKTAQEEGFISNLDKKIINRCYSDKDIFVSISTLILKKRAGFVYSLND